jgi:ubiquitin-activating enzyme E1
MKTVVHPASTLKNGLDKMLSRQEALLGSNFQQSYSNLSILLLGSGTLAQELVRQLMLLSPKLVSVHCNKEGERNLTSYLSGLAFMSINTKIEVNTSPFNLETSITKEFHLVVCTDKLDIKEVVEINQYCREQNIGFIYSNLIGNYGNIFVDFGKDFTIQNPESIECQPATITNITHENPGKIEFIHGGPPFFNDDIVRLKNIKGMLEVNESTNQLKEVKKSDETSDRWTAKICDTSTFGKFDDTSEATFEKYIEPYKIWQLPLQNTIPLSPEDVIDDFTGLVLQDPHDMRSVSPQQKHLIFITILRYIAIRKSNPTLHSVSELLEIYKHMAQALANKKLELAKKAKGSQKFEEDQENEEVTRPVPLDSLEQFLRQIITLWVSPNPLLATLFGSYIAGETLKYIGRYKPLNQWFHFDCTEIFKHQPKLKPDIEYTVENIIGNEAFQKIQNLEILMVGVGALGCEYLHQFASLGFGTGPLGEIHIVDNDTVSITNLNRQYLFNEASIGQNKAEAAVKQMKKLSPKMNLKSHSSILSETTENVYGDDFFDGVDIIVSAVDNMEARKYLVEKARLHNKWLFDSGTLGTTFSFTPIIPNHSSTDYYLNHKPKESETPEVTCTGRGLPTKIADIYQESHTMFLKEFTDKPIKFQAQKNLAPDAADSTESFYLDCEELANDPVTFCFKQAKDLLETCFIRDINDIILSHAAEEVDSEGQNFWRAPKRYPSPLANLTSDDAVRFVLSAAGLYAKTFSLNLHFTSEEAMNFLTNANPHITKTQNVIENHSTSISVEFDKDDDDLLDFCYYFSKLRCQNYRYQGVDKEKLRILVGKITPSIIISTSQAVTLSMVEILKYVQNLPYKEFTTGYGDMALPTLSQTRPIKCEEDSTTHASWWNLIVIKEKLTVQQIVDYLENKFSVTVNQILYRSQAIYRKAKKILLTKKMSDKLAKNPEMLKEIEAANLKTDDKKLNSYPEAQIDVKPNQRYMLMEVITSSTNLPPIKYYIN